VEPVTTRPLVFFAIALILVVTAGALLFLPPDAREVPLAAPFELFPVQLTSWSVSESGPEDLLEIDSSAPRHLFRTYRSGDATVSVSVEYYPSQDEGRRPAAQRLLFPRSGWSHLSATPFRIPVDDRRSIPATQVMMRTPTRRVAILYWYQVGRESISSDHWYRAFLVYHRLFHRRSDGALVRVASAVPDGADPAPVVTRQTEFVRAFYPALLRSLPE
jgi:EpsI family protein